MVILEPIQFDLTHQRGNHNLTDQMHVLRCNHANEATIVACYEVYPMTQIKFALACLLMACLALSAQTQGDQTQTSGASPSSSTPGGSYGGSGAGPGIPGGAYGGSGGGYGSSNVPYGGSTSRGPSASSPSRTSPSTTRSRQTPTQDRSRDTTRRDTYNSSDRSNRNNGIRRMGTPIYLYGRVVTDGGEAPPERVVIKLNCGTRSMPQGYTDRKGQFSFQPGRNPHMLADASVSYAGRGGVMSQGLTTGPSGSATLSHCHLEAELAGYRSDRLQLPMLRMGSTDVGLIVLHRLEGLIGDTVSITTLAAPANAKKAYQKGIKALRKMNPNREQAVRHLERAVQAYPKYAPAWLALGEARMGLDDAEGARQAYTRSIEADPKFLLPYQPMMQMALDQNDWADVESLAASYLKLSPRSSKFRFLSALAAASLRDLSRAESILQSMGELNEKDDWPLSYVIMAMVHEGRAEWEQAADEYTAYIGLSLDDRTVGMAKRRLYEWEMLQVIEPRETMLARTP